MLFIALLVFNGLRGSINAGTRTYEKRSTKFPISSFSPHEVVIFVQDHRLSLHVQFYNVNSTGFMVSEAGYEHWVTFLREQYELPSLDIPRHMHGIGILCLNSTRNCL